MIKVKRAAAIYFILQGLAVALWWLLLFTTPASRKYFILENNSETSLMAFWLPDLMFLAGGSLVAGWLVFRDNKHAPVALWLVAGAMSYAALYCLAFAYITDTGWLGVILMLPAMIWSGVFATTLSSVQELMFRQAKVSSTGWILVKTYAQIIVAWSIILIIFPYLITIIEDKLSIPRFRFQFQEPLAAILFASISFLGVASAHTMARIGQGTPLPLDSSNKLVVRGTYSYVRNPMAISGIGQGLMVALWFGSPLVALYALMGSLIWQIVFRPIEEDDLVEKFGADYEDYRKHVRCWIPSIRSYRAGEG
jgi:protein-S-isoprenylcysteine O-methyltransferase Ste14